MIDEVKIFNKAINSFLQNSKKSQNFKLKKVFFLRNEQVENFAEKINNYSILSKLKFKFFYSGYDNSLPIPNEKYDLSIIWLDYTSFKLNTEFFKWIKFKADELSRLSEYVLIKPIITPNIKLSKAVELNNQYKKILKNEKIIFLNIFEDLLEKRKEFWDIDRSDFFGTKTSLYGQDLQSKLLGLKVLPSLFKQKIKSIIFDLDDTLYTGVIGEDGIKKIYLDKNQKKAVSIYSKLYKEGTLLSICSKNNKEDVELVFKNKILKKNLFFPIKANWELKSKNIQEIQKILKVSFHNILFIDNNISEVIEVKKRYPDINIFWSHNSNSFLNCLKYYPNLLDYFDSNSNEINKKRIFDLKASLKREKLLSNSKNKNHLVQLQMKMDFRLNNKKEFDRIFSLTNKVNQFIFNFKRFNKNKVNEYIKKPNKFVFTISLKDRFSDSGNIGVVYFSKIDDSLFLDEICISCRALGRQLEDYFIFFPLKILLKKYKFDNLNLQFVKGPKNNPAKKYFDDLKKKFTKKKSNKKNILDIPINQINKVGLKNKDVLLNYIN